MAIFEHNHCAIYYELLGAGQRVIFVNGSGSSIDLSRPLIEVFGKKFLVAVHDQRGLGKSSVPDGPYCMADYATDVIALADHLGWSTFSLFGISFGGMVAQEVAVTQSHRIDRLVLACTSSGGHGGSSFPLHELTELSPDERLSISNQIIDSRFSPEWFATHPQDRIFTQPRAVEVDDRKRLGMQWQLEARKNHDVWDRLMAITCPTLVTSGAFDGIASAKNGLALSLQIPNSEYRLYQGGHMFVMQDKLALADILNFLDNGSL